MRTREEEKTESAGRRLYRGCENCGHYTGRVCRITGEELTMVCEKWEEKGENRPGQLEHHTESSEEVSG